MEYKELEFKDLLMKGLRIVALKAELRDELDEKTPEEMSRINDKWRELIRRRKRIEEKIKSPFIAAKLRRN